MATPKKKAKAKRRKPASVNKNRVLNVVKDVPDIRDRWYEPSLIPLQKSIDNRQFGFIRDQGKEGACTGFGLAAVIDLLKRKNKNRQFKASTRMLYEMAKRHDEWPGFDYSGSSCRGAIRGWKNMGVCGESDWSYDTGNLGHLTVERALAARETVLGAYYRLRPEISEYHAALNEVDAIFVSATVHEGWWAPREEANQDLAEIEPSTEKTGGHAFAIVGYNSDGFIIQNSWGEAWGSAGFALWRYEDWLENVSDGWVFRLALPTPVIFGRTSPSASAPDAEFFGRAPKRLEIAGHFIHFDDGKFQDKGDYWSNETDVRETADRIKTSASDYKHLLIYAHGGLNSPKASANRVVSLKDGFKRNGVYPVHMMYDTGIAEEIKDAVRRALVGGPAENFLTNLRDKIIEKTDKLIEDVVRKPVTPLWDEMKRDARLPWQPDASGEPGDGEKAIEIFTSVLKDTGIQIHLAGHSTGAVLLGHLLGALDKLELDDLLSSCTLLAPACSMDFFREHYKPRLGKTVSGRAKLPKLDIYNLNKTLELDDQTAGAYRKSLLYLVSRALERQENKPLLGMEKYSNRLATGKGLSLYYSSDTSGKTRSTSHGGFDNDAHTMNSLLKRILGEEPALPFTEAEMKGY